MSSEALERAKQTVREALEQGVLSHQCGVDSLAAFGALLAEVARLEQELSLLDRNATVWHADECGVHNANPPWRCTCDGSVLREQVARLEQERDEANAKAGRKEDEFLSMLGASATEYVRAEAAGAALAVARERAERAQIEADTFRQAAQFHAREAAVAREREQRLRSALRDAIANLDAAVCADYPLWAALVDEPAAATLVEPGRGEWKPPARVGEECSPVTADVTTPAPGSASAAADEPGETP